MVLEALAISHSCLKAHTTVRILEREVPGLPPESGSGDVYGIGIGTGDGSLFWFHSRTEAVETRGMEESAKE